jgi:serine/threonine protein kinase
MSDLSYIGPYQILNMIGEGGMATVYRAIQPSIGREVAIKVLPPYFLQHGSFLDRFNLEVKVIARLQHPRILPVYDSGEHNGQPYIVMAYITGGTLAATIENRRLPMNEAAHYTRQIAEGLSFSHRRGVIHRDLKPSNVLLDEENNVYLADFGIAKVIESATHLTEDGFVGTASYMPPEILSGGDTTKQVDVYALGVTLYQMLSGRLPYNAGNSIGMLYAHVHNPVPNVRDLRPELPEAVQQVIEHAMAKDPALRTPGAHELWMELQQAMSVAVVEVPNAISTPTELGYSASALNYGETPPLKGEDLPETVPDFALEEQVIQPPSVTTQPDPLPGPRIPVLAMVLTGIFVLGGLIVGTLWLTGVLRTIDPARAVALAEAGVERNDEWTPYIQEYDGVPMALVPKGCFMMGGNGADEGPIHRVCFEEPFWIDVTEVTVEQYGSSGCGESSSSANQPLNCIIWNRAVDHCKGRNAVLPTEARWEYAARGPDGLEYPWGNEFAASRVVGSGTQAAVVGSKPAGASWVGALDMSGNVWEWVVDGFAEYQAGTQIDPIATGSSNERVLRGGSWDEAFPLNLRTANRNRNDPYISLPTYGFRCAMDYDAQ